MIDYVEETRNIMGPDSWSYGFRHNKNALRTAPRWSHEQGLTPELLDPSNLFVRSTLSEIRI
jgi:4,5-dihydroxyphthalate decarboxylase